MDSETAQALDSLRNDFLRMAGMGEVLERAIAALISTHPQPEAVNQALLAELHPSKIPDTAGESQQAGWHAIAARLLTHSVALAVQAQSQRETKN